MKLSGLVKWYDSIKKENHTYDITDISYNKTEISILFDIGKTPFSLTLIRNTDSLIVDFPINKGFILETSLPTDKYNLLRLLLNIPNGKNAKFSTNEFFSKLNEQFPNSYCNNKVSKQILNKIYNFEENDKLIYDSLINWEKNMSNKHHTKENHEKTRILYPEIYEKIKDKDISVRYRVS